LGQLLPTGVKYPRSQFSLKSSKSKSGFRDPEGRLFPTDPSYLKAGILGKKEEGLISSLSIIKNLIVCPYKSIITSRITYFFCRDSKFVYLPNLDYFRKAFLA